MRKLYEIRPNELSGMCFAQWLCLYRHVRCGTNEYKRLFELLQREESHLGLGVEQRRNRKLIQKPKFRFLDQTFGFCRFRFRRKQKDSGEESRKIIFFAFTLESENKILPLIQKAEFNILLSFSEINAEKRIFLLSSWLFLPFVAKILQSYRNRNLQKPKV